MDEFLSKCKKVHGDKYDYSKVEYTNSKSKVIIICKKHGEFDQIPSNHVRGYGCPKCNRESVKHTLNEFIERCKEVHGDRYDYSLVKYETLLSKVTIICKKHGEFEQVAIDHMRKRGCPKCGRESMADKTRVCQKKFIAKCKKVHENKYSYDNTIYNSAHSVITITCPKHGEFQQKANDHMQGCGCPHCGRETIIDKTKDSQEEFIAKCIGTHGNKYDYSKSVYLQSYSKVSIICKKHGEFKQDARNHIRGRGCPRCQATYSYPHQQLVDFIKTTYDKEVLINDRETIKPLELDIYLPDVKIGIEVDGMYYHSYDKKETTHERLKHYNKHTKCEGLNIKLLRFKSSEILNDRKFNIIKSIMKSRLQLSDKIYARKCDIKKLENEDCSAFLNLNHMQGFRPANVSYGLYYDSVLMSVMSFSKHHKYDWEIMRFATKLGHNIVGGASKLFKKFVVDYNPDSILTFADRRYATGNVYIQLGFGFKEITKPNYLYWKDNSEYSRQKCQKHKLHKLLPVFDGNKPESENMFANGYRRYWDCGNFKFTWLKNRS